MIQPRRIPVSESFFGSLSGLSEGKLLKPLPDPRNQCPPQNLDG